MISIAHRVKTPLLLSASLLLLATTAHKHEIAGLVIFQQAQAAAPAIVRGELPAGFPDVFPLPEDHTVTLGMSRGSADRQEYEVLFHSSLTAAELSDYYRSGLPDAGFTIERDRQNLGGGRNADLGGSGNGWDFDLNSTSKDGGGSDSILKVREDK